MDAEQYSSALGADEEEEDDGSGFVQSITAGSHHVHPQSDASAFAAHSDFGRPELTIDPALNAHTDPAHQQPQEGQHGHQHQDDPHRHVENHYGNQHIQRQLYTDLARSANQYTLHTPSEQHSEQSPSQFTSASPAPTAPKIAPAFAPTDRSLPDKQVTDETLDDAFVAFILYCNPSVPLDCDTTELRKVFRQPPKSDGKTFNVYHLLQLIEKFERKDIKTWTKLAIELGVERTPDSSTQKVQQYAVRLKRWMHAMHVDAFFEYILDKAHSYYQHIPPVDADNSSSGSPERVRDGVPVEEDLALRALHPETRPKRGRRKTDDKDDSSDKDGPTTKRQHLDLGTPADDIGHFVYPNSGVPSSAGADGMTFLDDGVTPDQWTAATHSVLSAGASTPTGAQQFRWRPYGKMDSAAPTPHSAHPNSSILGHDGHPGNDDLAPTPTSTKAPRRRRHGPAVSSAWPSSGNPLTGKLRGRPPSNRSMRDGPFSTFPANPAAKGGTTIEISPVSATPTPTPMTSHPPQHQFNQFRPPSLHLTVPQQPTRPITMASPAVERPLNGNTPHVEWSQPPPPMQQHPKQGKNLGIPALQEPAEKSVSFEDLERQLAVAILQIPGDDVTNIGIDDSNVIASKVLSKFRRMFPDSGGGGGEKLAILTGTTSTESGFKGLQVHRLQSELEELGIHAPDHEDDENGDGSRGETGERRYQIKWETSFGEGLKGEFEQIVVLSPPERPSEDFDGLAEFDTDDTAKPGEEGVDELRKKVQELEDRLKGKDRELGRFKESVLKAVVS